MGIPAVCGVDEAALSLPDGARVVIDGTHGLLRVNPDDRDVSLARERIARLAAQREADLASAFAQARTRDGHRVEVVANIRNVEDAREAVAAGAEGVGLLRSEFLFLGDRAEAPSEDEQAAAYAAVAETLGKERRLVVRTLDVGGDKPLSYLPLPREANPFLGIRGIRFSLEHPDLFRTQLRAILRAAPFGNVHVMFPMIATLDELRAAKRHLAEEQRAVPHAVKVGIMVEVPSAAIAAEVLAREVDFVSIGTNDLTQYTLAMDRAHPQLARQADALHPAVLRMIAMTVEGAHEHGKWVGVCGGLASDPLAVPLLTGLGVDELSVGVPAIAPVKAALGRWTLDACMDLATGALRLRTIGEVRSYLAEHVDETGSLPAERVLP
jgi:phosphocarrier protein FPr/phosphocarrier protein